MRPWVLVTAAAGARSAESLGKQRAGSGVVIGSDGLILTIGYLLLEADTIQVTTQDNRTLPARAVAYDLATGFGLLRPLLPPRGVTPVPLGSQADDAAGEALMVATGGNEGDVAMTQLVSKRLFSGYWEYHIESALFTSPPVGNHSGAPLFNQRGELLGIGSLFVMDALANGQRPTAAGQHVRARGPAKAHPGRIAADRQQQAQPPPLAGPDVQRAGRAGAGGARQQGQSGAGGRPAGR